MPIIDAYTKLPAHDPERARAFWRDHFGLEPFAENHGHLFYDVQGRPVLVFPTSGAPSGDHDQLGLVVDDLDAEVARLRSEGVEFQEFPPPPGVDVDDGLMDFGTLRAGWFRDSEGNLISIAQFVDGSPFRR
jgi:catechol 2,3-dioxygenase-like lactoylglutathione lyase family enzyme